MYLQPLDPSCRRQSIRRGLIISLPILIIYLLLYLLRYVLIGTEIGRHHLNTVARFWHYTRRDGFQNVASLCTLVTAQFTHGNLEGLARDSLVLVGIASISGSVFNRRTFFAVYILGGFLAAAADCAWARATNLCQSPIQPNDVLTSVRIINEAIEFIRSWTNLEDANEKIAKDHVRKYLIARDWLRWNELNPASSGSLLCLSMLPTHKAFPSMQTELTQMLMLSET